MKWTDINRSPFAVNDGGEIRIAGQSGEVPGLIWYWAGERGIRGIRGGSFESTGEMTGELKDPEGVTVAFVAPIGDTPEITDVNEANRQFLEIREMTQADGHDDFIAAQVKMKKRPPAE